MENTTPQTGFQSRCNDALAKRTPEYNGQNGTRD